jgi:hypothetical protein
VLVDAKENRRVAAERHVELQAPLQGRRGTAQVRDRDERRPHRMLPGLCDVLTSIL